MQEITAPSLESGRFEFQKWPIYEKLWSPPRMLTKFVRRFPRIQQLVFAISYVVRASRSH